MPAIVKTVMVRVVLISLHPHLRMLTHVTWPMVYSRLERVRCLGNNHYAAGNEETLGGGGHSVTVRCHERGGVSRTWDSQDNKQRDIIFKAKQFLNNH